MCTGVLAYPPHLAGDGTLRYVNGVPSLQFNHGEVRSVRIHVGKTDTFADFR